MDRAVVCWCRSARRRIVRLTPVVALLWATVAAADVETGSRSPASLSRLSIEELADIQISSVSKRPERLADAPAAVYVVTREDIRRAGVASIPEALRLAPNLQVARSNSNTYAISARGFNGTSPNKLLVLIDGRSVYTPLNSGVFWDTQDLMLEDIDRIEVVSGPGGTLWGANAVNGVINIVTRHSKDTQGVLATVSGGTDDVDAALRYGARMGDDASWRVYAKGFRRDRTVRANGAAVADAWNLRQVGFRADWGRASNAVMLRSDIYDGTTDVPGQPPQRTVFGASLLGRWNRDLGDGAGLQAQAYFDRARRDQPGVFTLHMDTFDIDVQHHFAWSRGHEIVWGGGYREQRDRTAGGLILAFVPADDELSLANVFVQDTMPLGERLKLTLGAKLERNSYTGSEFLPNLRLAWNPNEHQLLWSAVSRAVRTPSRVDRGLQSFVNLGKPYNAPLMPGNNFVSETLTAYEVGYRAQPSPRASFSISTFYNDYDKLRSFQPVTGGFALANQIEGRTSGVEMWGSYQVNEFWRLSAGYNRLNESFRFKPGSADPGKPTAGAQDPKYQASLRSSHDLPRGITLDVGVRAVGALPDPAVPSHVALDARLGWTVAKGVELSLAGFNLLDARHPEFGAAPARSEIGRSVLLKLLWKL